MEKNKKIVVIAVLIICLFILGGYLYMSLFYKSKENKKTKIEFEFPEIVNMNKHNGLKMDYYANQLKEDDISDGFFIEKRDSILDSIKYRAKDSVAYGLYKEEELVEEGLERVNKEYSSSQESSNEVQGDENLNRLLNIMESNSDYMNNIGKEVSSSNDIEHIEDFEDFNEDNINRIIKKGVSEDQETIPERVIYRKIPEKENSSKNVFFGATKSNKAFTGAISEVTSFKEGLFKAELYTTQTIENGGLIIIHLLEDLFFDEDIFIPKSTILYGIASFSPTRLFLRISPNILKNQRRLPRPIIVYDFDGLEGIFMQINSLGSIPVDTSRELTDLVKESYKNANPLSGNSGAIPIKEASILIGSEKIIKYLNRLKIKISGGYKIWLSISEDK